MSRRHRPLFELQVPLLCQLSIIVSLLLFHLGGPVLAQSPEGQTHGFVSFAVSRLEVEEDGSDSEFTTALIPFLREVGTTGVVFATMTVINPTANEDFFSPNNVVMFPDAVTTASASLVLFNDMIPEGNETFQVQITSTFGGAEIGSQNMMELVVRASDEPHGEFQFAESSAFTVVSEPIEGSSTVQVQVIRGPGIFGRVTIDFQVVSGPNLGLDDFSPAQGELVFSNEISLQTINLSIIPDEIPEGNETFTLRLSNPSGGAVLAGNLTEAQITILENDTPVRFTQAVTQVSEDSGSVDVTITRGLLEDGTQIGNLDVETAVQYATVAGSATAGMDFTAQSDTITFSPGVNSQTISIAILGDEEPEGDETFTIVLSNASPDAVTYAPSVAMIVIEVNDNAGGLVQFDPTSLSATIGEDDASVARFTIQRTVGTFSDLVVAWRIIDNINLNLAAADFQPPSGQITIPDGESEVVLEIRAFDDSDPEVAEQFMVQLVGVVDGEGQLNEQGIRVASLIVTESDDVFGLIEWAEDSSLEVAATTPRELRLALTRSGGNIGIISVDYGVVYLPLGVVDSALGDTSVVTMAMGSVQLQGGQTSLEFSVEIQDEAFLEPMANFFVYLNSTTLLGGATFVVPTTVSPSIGPRSEALVSVSPTAANGYTGFDPEFLQVSAEEPLLSPETISLRVTRSGAFGEASVTWGITLGDTSSSDIGATTGVVTIAHGSTSATIEVIILPDDLPEVDELFFITLLAVAEQNQRILSGLNTATVTILQNDNAEGVFFISSATRGPYLIQESTNEVLPITIQRQGGALTTQRIQYETQPEGQDDFFGGFGFVDFAPGQRNATITILPQSDIIPEINETFFFSISAGEGGEDILGDPTSVMITILANDDFAGVFLFETSSLILSIDEPRSSSSPVPTESVALFTIQRDAGAFTAITVSWEVTTAGSGANISPTSGTVDFGEGQQSGTFEIQALPDEIPEQDETFTVVLTGVSGAARLSSVSTEASLVVRQNDDPINFNASSTQAAEGQTAVLTVTRGGQAIDVAEVSFQVQYDLASPNDVTVTPAGGVLVFQEGRRDAQVMVTITDDVMPEESETLRVELTATTGDAVIVPPSEATVQILPSDDPNGVFQFAEGSRAVTREEGITVQLEIERLQGTFGAVTLQWTIYQLSTETGDRFPASSEDVSPITDTVSFLNGSTSNVIQFDIVDDILPELQEIFQVELAIIIVLGDSEDGARLGEFSIAMVTVPESDFPYGLFRVAEDSRVVEIAEDVPANQLELGRVMIVVERTFGTLSDVQVTWEILPRLDNPLPPFTDLLFFGIPGSAVSPAQSRNGTGTTALGFTGQAGSIVSVPTEYQPVITNGFTISLWLQPAADSSGVLVAKTTGGGSTRFYSLNLVADGDSFLIRLAYLPASVESGFSTVEASVPQSSLGDGSWHSLAVAVGAGTAVFYQDGSSITSRTLEEASIGDGPGELTVGGLSGGEYYTGQLQDVRIYPSMLTASQAAAIGSDAASAEVTPISGYLSFAMTETEGVVSITSLDDEVPEPSQFFTFGLAASNGGSEISREEDTAYLTVLKSDAGNGIFSFDPQSLSNTIPEPGSVSLQINRARGTFETVLITWEIREVSGGVVGGLAMQDFDPASGQIEFLEGETQQQLYLEAVNELVPELVEDFIVVLVSADAADNQTSSTPTSGASIDVSLAQSNLTIEENDYPYGLLQFVTSPPTPGTQILPAVVLPELFVDESDGMITVYVVRAQGNLGTVSIEYITQDGTASSTGVGPDYISSAGMLTFGPDDVVQSFMVTLLDDLIPELGKTFFINLTNPGGDLGTPGLAVGSTIAINILPSDDAFGVFSFEAGSLARVVEEQAGGTPVTLTVIRSGGTFGDVTVYWEVEGPEGDIAPGQGVVELAEGERAGELVVTVADDLDPELLEVFNIRLVNASGSATLSTAGDTVATVTVQANDHPYGLFVFSPVFRPLAVSEGVPGGSVTVMVTREFGTLGMVRVDYETIASDQVASSPALQGIDVEELQQNSNIATTGTDYLSASGSVIFDENQTTQSFSLTLLEDTLPELDEYIFIVLTSVELNETSTASVDLSVPPAIPAGNESLAVIVITENDDARGVVQFTASVFNTTEPSQDFVTLVRLGGSFGEVSVQWEASPNTADTSDYTPMGARVTFPPEVSSATIPLFILDDVEPEFAENFIVRLLDVSIIGGARLGDIDAATINILPSDDPNGALEFSPVSRLVQVEEPEGETPATLSLVVQRLGGRVGVIEVVWNITPVDTDSDPPDILPSSGLLQFVSDVVQQEIELSVLPDDIPEILETFIVRLESVNGGARIADNSEAMVEILPNDSPFGVVSFDSSLFTAVEGDDDIVSMVPITRSLGTFGDLRLTYSVQPVNIATLATADGTPVLDFFSTPIPDVVPSSSLIVSEPSVPPGSSDVTTICASECLADQACLSFATDDATYCRLYLAILTPGNSVSLPGANYYAKDLELVQPFTQAVATLGNDFSPATGSSVIIPDGASTAAIPVTIVGDTLSELNESLIVTLTAVELVIDSRESFGSGPQLGAITEAEVVILENDDPHGQFFLFGSNGEDVIRVRETQNFGVSLTVERRGGTIGEVQVSWAVVSGIATEGQDYAGTGAVLTFPDGSDRSSIAITILEDDIPERDEDLLIALVNPTGGATVAPDNEGTTLVIIEANDNAAGIVGLAPFSRSAVVAEGQEESLVLERRIGALGVVSVDWEITGPGNVTQEFVSASGTATFAEGDNTTEILIEVRADSTPEVAEPFTLTLLAVRTESTDISPSGWATLDSQASTATITIQASDNPHGVVEFQPSSAATSSPEAPPSQLTIIRQFGAFGAIEVTYRATSGNLTTVPPGTSLATAGDDFLTDVRSILLADGQQSTVITAPIVDDSDPELAEVFLVQLLSVTLLDGLGDTIAPSIGTLSVATVTIVSNDSPQGEFTFQQSTISVAEDVGSVEVVVLREQGLVGEVSVVYVVTNVEATNGEDFTVQSLDELTFAAGQSEATIPISIVDDAIPEVDEQLCVQLNLPEGGAILGNISQICVTILANDDAHGVFSFDPTSLSSTLVEAGEITTVDSVAQLRVIREGGRFEQVTIPFEVEQAGREDLSPAMGGVVFAAGEEFEILQLEALMDAIPEQDEVFMVTLLPPPTLGRLATTNTVATITILANQDPSGVLEIFPSNNASTISVEEDVQYVVFEVRRTFGSQGEVSVAIATTEDTAVAPTGNPETITFAAIQLVETVSAERWYQFTRGERQFLALASGSAGGSVLYVWRGGVFAPVQSLSLAESTAFTFLSPGEDLLVATSGGSPGSREANSTVYRFIGEEQLQILQSISTVGASDVVSFQAPSGDWYIVIAGSEDSEGSPSVDSLVLRWTGTRFEQTQTLATIGASALEVFVIGDTIYLAVASFTDTRSPVYEWRDGQFRLLHTVDTQQATDVAFIDAQGGNYLIIAEAAGVSLLVWSPESQQFAPNITLSAPSALRVETLPQGLLVVTNGNSNPGQLFLFAGDVSPTELTDIPLPAARHLYPFTLGSSLVPLLAVATNTQPGTTEQSLIKETQFVDTTADFYPRAFNLTFAPGETSHTFVVEVINDLIPEVNEAFSVRLMEPVGGVRLGDQSVATVTILTNDDAHGLIGFAASSRSVIAQELDINTAVVLEVERRGGTFGQVRASWEVTGEHNEGEVTPTSGEVVFLNGSSLATISLQIQPDVEPELNEVTQVLLTAITESGIAPGEDPTRGAELVPSQTLAVVTVQANDAPHGVIVWSPDVVMATEEEDVENTVQLTLIREFGSLGAIVISYTTTMDPGLPTDEQATQEMDFLSTSGSVAMGDGETSATVSVTILPDDLAELAETFLVSITEVRLADEGDRQGSTSDSPRTNPGEESVRVVISENDNSRGILSFAQTAISVEENAGSVLVAVSRTGGTFGTVGVDFAVTGVTATGGGVDFSPDAGSVGSILMGEEVALITVNITNDVEPELEETFLVTLTNALRGAQLGSPTTATVTILRNDDINGVFSFADDSLLFLIPESITPDDPLGVVTLTVRRTRNFVGRVTVYWEVSEDGRLDLEPASGNLTFLENEQEQSFQVRAIGDGLPELFEAFSVTLVSADGGGRIADPREARIAIQASDDPSGLIGFEETGSIVISEGDQLMVRLLRTAGLQGVVTVTWEISPPDSGVFVTTSDTVFFSDGQEEANVVVQTLSDDIPEVARLFTLRIISAGVARVNLSSSEVNVIVTASDSPHGIVEFAQPLVIETEEIQTMLAFTVQRNFGLVGTLRVEFSVIPDTAITPEDFNVLSQSVIIPGDTASGTITAEIVNDDLPEILESFSIVLNSVELDEDISGGRDFEVSDPSLIDQLPSLGTSTQLEVRILENDDPYGTISLVDSVFQAAEGETAALTLIRTGGRFGTVAIQYSDQGVTATRGEDYSISSSSSEVFFAPDQASLDILVPIIDDGIPELQESFSISITLSEPLIGAQLGSITMATVIIDASDSPFGEVGFSDVTPIQLENPSVDEGPVVVSLTVQRTAGLFGSTDVTWLVEGPEPGREHLDIDASSIQGTLMLVAGQSSGVIEIIVLPNEDGPEPEETFTVTIISASNNVFILPDQSSVTISVAQVGMPFGVIAFFGDALQLRRVSEQETISLPLIRTEETVGATVVLFTVTGDSPNLDVSPVSSNVSFGTGQSQANLVLEILSDSTPELEETYAVTLREATGGAAINPLAAVSMFVIRANEAPYGRFGVASPFLTASPADNTITRTLTFTLSRQMGTVGTVLVEAAITYDPDPATAFVESPVVSEMFEDGDTEREVTVAITENVFLAPNTTFTIDITGASLLSPQAQEGVSPEISPSLGSAQVVVTEDMANPLVGFDLGSLEASVNDDLSGNNVDLTIVRRGRLGVVLVSWETGLPNTSLASGSITPPTGSVQMEASESSTVISLRAVPRDPHGEPEVFAVRLSVVSLTPLFPAQVDPAIATTTIEPYGVVQLARESYSGVEGQQASVTVWRRYGSTGTIQVTGVAMVAPGNSIPANQEAATVGTDFAIIPVSTILEEGSTVGTIGVPLPDNEDTSPLKVFRFMLTAVQRVPQPLVPLTSPRLASSNLSASVTIIDDEAGAGLFRFTTTPPTTIEELGSPAIPLTITRAGGTMGRVTVIVRSVDGRVDSITAADEMASASSGDYELIDLELVFEDGESEKLMNIRINDDSIPELMEYFTVLLENPPAGSALIDPDASTFEVAIASSDNPNGIFSLVETSLTLNEDTALSGTLTIRRNPGLFGSVAIEWEALYDDGGVHPVPIADILAVSRATILFQPGQTSAPIELQLQANGVPEGGEQFTLRILSDASGIALGTVEANITVVARGSSVFQIREEDRRVVVSGSFVPLVIERVDGLQLTADVTINTSPEPGETVPPAIVEDLSFITATPSVHFTDTTEVLSFTATQARMTVIINIITTDVSEPVAFYVDLTTSSQHSVVETASRATIVIYPANTLSELYNIYFTTLRARSPEDLETVSGQLLSLLQGGGVSGQNRDHADTTRFTVNRIVTTASAINTGSGTSSPTARRKRYTEQLRDNLLDVFQQIIGDVSFSQMSRFVQSQQSFAYSLLDGLPCPPENSTASPLVYLRSSFYMEVVRLRPSGLFGRRFTSRQGEEPDFLQLPTDTIFTTPIAAECIDVHYIEFSEERLFMEPTFRSRVFSIGIRDQSLPSTANPIVYRIHGNNDLSPSDEDCLWWRYPSTLEQQGSWIFEENNQPICRTRTRLVLRQDYIECECSRLGDFAAVDDIRSGYGWTLPAPISCAFVMVVMLMVITLHVVYFQRTQLATRILLMLCISIFFFQMMALVDAFASDSASIDGCTALGLLLQFTVVAQFIWIVALAVALWVNFIGITDGREPLIIYIIISWVIAVLVVVVTILVGRFAPSPDLQWSELYGLTGDICYMPKLSAALLSTVLPIMVLVLATIALLSHSCVHWSHWEDFHNMYHDSFNRTEIPLLLVFFVLIFLNWLLGGIHMYHREAYTFGLFVALNCIEGIYALVVYFFISWHTLTRKHKKYGIGEEVEPLALPGEPDYLGSLSTLASSRQHLVAEEEWDDDTSTIPAIVPLGVKHVSSDQSIPTSLSNGEDSHLDDLLFALKTQNYPHSYDESDDSDSGGKKPSGSERLELRRISIADTHL